MKKKQTNKKASNHHTNHVETNSKQTFRVSPCKESKKGGVVKEKKTEKRTLRKITLILWGHAHAKTKVKSRNTSFLFRLFTPIFSQTIKQESCCKQAQTQCVNVCVLV